MDSEFKLPNGRRELKIGDSLKNNGTSFHGIRYDFKPSNEEKSDSAKMEITSTNQVTLKYNEGSSDFMYSGTMRQFPKEYFLVIDHVTGEVTLEKLTTNIQLKRTKVSNSANKLKNQNNKKLEIEKESSMSPEILHASSSPEECGSQHTLHSLDDDESSMTGFESKFPINLLKLAGIPQQENEFGLSAQDMVECMTSSSSDKSSDSDSDSSSSSSSTAGSRGPQTRVNGYPNGRVSPTALKGHNILTEDLQLSESGSDSD